MGQPESLTVAETIVLLALKEDGKPVSRNEIPGADVVDAQVLELGVLGALRLEDKEATPVPGFDVPWGLRPAYQALLQKESWKIGTPTSLALVRNVPSFEKIARMMVERGILSERKTKVLGVLPRREFPTVDPRPRQETLARLLAVTAGDAEPTDTDAMLFLLRANELRFKVIPKDQRNDASKRMDEIIKDAAKEGGFLRAFVKAKGKDWTGPGVVGDLLKWFE